MAKKSTKKSAGKRSGKAASKPVKSAKKAAKPARKGASGAKASMGPSPVSSGRGASPLDIGTRLVNAFNAGKVAVNDELWSKSIVSVEGLGVCQAWSGRKAVDGKNAWWNSTHRVHGASAEGPYVGATGFAVKFQMDIEDTSTGQRSMMTEVGVYTVQDGKIVREEFMYSAR